MFDPHSTIEFLDRVCALALKDAETGDDSLLNAIQNHEAVADYLNRVYVSEIVTREGWFPSAPQFMLLADQFRQSVEAELQREALDDMYAEIDDDLAALASDDPDDEADVDTDAHADDEPAEAEHLRRLNTGGSLYGRRRHA